jgi:hypothetical protein
MIRSASGETGRFLILQTRYTFRGMDFNSLLSPATLIFLIPVLAIVAGIVGMLTRHRERMAMIERGMDPDQGKLDREKIEQRR